MKKLPLLCIAIFFMGPLLPAFPERAGQPKTGAERGLCISTKSGFLSLLRLRLSGGYGGIGSGDFDQDLISHDRIYRDLASSYEKGSLAGSHRTARGGLGGGADFLISLSERLALGLGFEYFHKDRTSSENLSLGWMEKSFEKAERTVSHRFDLAGILLKADVSFPFSKRFALFVGAGAGLYSARIRHDLQWEGAHEFWGFGRHIDQNGMWKTDWFKFSHGNWSQKDSISVSKKKIGGSGWLGIRFFISRRLSLFLQGKASLLRLSGPRARESYFFLESRMETAILADLREWKRTDDLESWDAEGRLEIYDFFSGDLNETYSFLTANRAYREREAANSNFRPAAINLNGLHILFGIEIKLF